MPHAATLLRSGVDELLQRSVQLAQDPSRNDRERSEGFENAACCEYYSGLYGQAALHFEQALIFRVTFAEDREIARLFIMVAVCCYKLGNITRAYQCLEKAVVYSKQSESIDFECMALSNMAIIEKMLNLNKSAIEKTESVMNLIKKEKFRNGPHAEKLLSQTRMHERVGVSVHMQSGNIGLAELAITASSLSDMEKLILQAGCKFVTGQLESASRLLEKCQELHEKRKKRIQRLKSLESSNINIELQKQPSTFALSREGSKAIDGPISTLSATSAITRDASADQRSEASVTSGLEGMEPIENETLIVALLFYNFGVLSAVATDYKRARLHFQTAIDTLTALCVLPDADLTDRALRERFCLSLDKNKLIVDIYTVFDAVDLDDLLVPATLMSQCICARAEAIFLESELVGASRIQRGAIAEEDDSQETIALAGDLSAAFNSLLDCHPNLRASLTPIDAAAETASKVEAATTITTPALTRGASSRLITTPSMSMRPATSSTVTSVMQPKTLSISSVLPRTMSSQSVCDILHVQEEMSHFRQLIFACVGSGETKWVFNEIARNLKNAKAPKRLIDNSEAMAKTSLDSPPVPGPPLQEGEIPAPKLTFDQILAPAPSSLTKSPGYAHALSLVPSNSNSVRFDMMAKVDMSKFNKFSREESMDTDSLSQTKEPQSQRSTNSTTDVRENFAKIVMEWALMVCEGAGMGPLGLSMIPVTKDYTERKRDKERDRIRTEARTAKERLLEIVLTKNLSNQVKAPLYAILAKICMHLGMRNEANNYMGTFDVLASSLNNMRLFALAKKFRADYEEWQGEVTTPATAPAKVKLKRLSALLTATKEYNRAANVSRDLNLIRDSCRRLVNVYIEIANAPNPSDVEFTELATVEELRKYTSREIEENETRDLIWMKRFSRARAREFMNQMKAIGASAADMAKETAAEEAKTVAAAMNDNEDDVSSVSHSQQDADEIFGVDSEDEKEIIASVAEAIGPLVPPSIEPSLSLSSL